MKKLKSVLNKLSLQTKTCKVCFKSFLPRSFRSLFLNVSECESCFQEKDPKFIKFKIGDISGLSIYEYDEKMKSMIFQLKGCFDIELRNTFLETYAPILNLTYFGYYKVHAPSYFEDDIKRGFNHVVEIFSPLKLKSLDILEKVEHHKQSDQLFKDRNQINKYIKVKNTEDLHGKKILLVDDIYTTGNTIKTCIELLKTLNPKVIKVLVLCKTKDPRLSEYNSLP